MRDNALFFQYSLGAIFLMLGAWALLFPAVVETLVLRPEHVAGSLASTVLMGCFGAQAVLCSILIFTTRFSAKTFLVFGLLASLPFFAFNYYFVFVTPLFNSWMALDLLGNIGILVCCLLGWRAKRREATA